MLANMERESFILKVVSNTVVLQILPRINFYFISNIYLWNIFKISLINNLNNRGFECQCPDSGRTLRRKCQLKATSSRIQINIFGV